MTTLAAIKSLYSSKKS